MELPSNLQVRQTANVHLAKEPLLGTIVGVHFYKDKVKYDIELCLNLTGEEEYTRIYNVDSIYVSHR